MRTPSHWQQHNWLTKALAPLAKLYGAKSEQRFWQPPVYKADCPVVCIGNFTAGGAGKTPFTLALGLMLQNAGQRPFVVSKGYGGREKGPVRVNPALHTARSVGDEPLLLSHHLPVIMGKSRALAAKRAIKEGATVILLDDGFQSPDLHKDFCIIIVSGKTGLGNGQVMPSGPLRLRLDAQLQKTDAMVVIESPVHSEHPSIKALLPTENLFKTTLQADARALDKSKAYCAFAGIADPSRFFDTARAQGLTLVETISYPDHHSFKVRDLSLLKVRLAAGLSLLTTEKDKMRLPAHLPVDTLPVSLEVPLKLQDKLLRYLRD